MLHGTQKYFTIVVLINVIPVYVEKTYIVNNKLRWYMVLKFQCGWNHCIKIVHLFTIKFLIKIFKMSLYLSLTHRERKRREREKNLQSSQLLFNSIETKLSKKTYLRYVKLFSHLSPMSNSRNFRINKQKIMYLICARLKVLNSQDK